MVVAPHACLLQVAFYVKARLCRSQVMQAEGSSPGGNIYQCFFSNDFYFNFVRPNELQ